MSTPGAIALHPAWVAKAGAGDIVRHWQLRGFNVSNGRKCLEAHPKQPLTAQEQVLAVFRSPCA